MGWLIENKREGVFKGVIVVLLVAAILISVLGTWTALGTVAERGEKESFFDSLQGGGSYGNVGFTIIDPEELNETVGE